MTLLELAQKIFRSRGAQAVEPALLDAMKSNAAYRAEGYAIAALKVGHGQRETHGAPADHNHGEGGDHGSVEAQPTPVPALPPVGTPHRLLLDDLIEQYVLLTRARKAAERELERLGESLPVWESWVKDVAGMSSSGLAILIYEIGDLSLYATVSKVWARMGLACGPGGGHQQLQKGYPPKAGPILGKPVFVPHRRAVAYNVGIGLFNQGTYYRDRALAYKIQEAAKPGCGKAKPRPAWDGEEPKNSKGCGGADGHCSKGHVHKRALRKMTKDFLADLWAHWNGCVRASAA
jgi:hypothetical protein